MYHTISPHDLKARLAAESAPILVDVRQPEEHADEHIPGSILIPLGELSERLDELEAYRGQDIVLYCRSGNRSAQACMYLAASGFENLYNLHGGMLTW
jgi:rhodanese-related sulfurtransferase